jgi:hypothetical protein
MGDLDPAELDPGIRALVMWLRARGIPTTDSGDGVSKPQNGDEVLPVPHVFASYPARDFGSRFEAFRVASQHAGFLDLSLPAREGTSIEVSYSPRDQTVVLALCGYTGADVPAEAT